MSETATLAQPLEFVDQPQPIDPFQLTDALIERIDELSTRLILNGVASLLAGDFQELSQLTPNPNFSAIAERLAALIRTAGPHVEAELMQPVSAGLEELRSFTSVHPAPVHVPDLSSPSAVPAILNVNSVPAPVASLAEDEELILEFITESNEHLVNIEGHMLALEKDSHDPEILNAVFRAFHTIKGLAGFLEFAAIQALAHEVETLLDHARNGALEVTPPVVDLILESTDVVRHELAGIGQRLAGNTPEPTAVNESLLQRIRNISRPGASSPVQADVSVHAPEPLHVQPEVATAPPASPQPTPSAPAAPAQSQPAPLQVSSAAANPVATPKAASAATAKPADAASIRIDTGKLDQLMDLVGEMVIAQTLIGHSPVLAQLTDARLLSDITQLARITADVQRITTGMRMVPIGLQFQKTARVIRDLSRRANKQIVLETSGEDTEVDKTIAEELSDPLLHMIRNSIDHGIETPEERIAAGKNPVAHIRLAAYHQSGQIVISISDDGRGLNKERIFNKAVERGLVQPGAQLTENEIFLLIFEAGFSTAEKVTDISGRGVGMDVVRRSVQALRGRIDVQSKMGEGTTFFLKLPLTLAIIEGLVVVVGDQRFIAPIFSVKEMFRPTPDMLSTVQGKQEMVMVRGGLLPIIRLHQRFNKQPRTSVLTEGTLIIAEAEGHQFCLFVDDLIGKQEVVIKSLGSSFKHLVGITGCAILGDGRVGLILDMHGIFKGRLK